MHSNYRIKFDCGRMLEHFGGVSGAVTAMELVGVTMKAKTLQKQKERGNIPADVVASLMLASVRAGRPLNPYDFLLERSDP